MTLNIYLLYMSVEEDIRLRLQKACKENKSWTEGGLNVSHLRTLAVGIPSSKMLRVDLLKLLCKDVPVPVPVPAPVPAPVPPAGRSIPRVAIPIILAPAAKLATLDDLMKSLTISDVTLLTTLSAEEIDYLISILTLHDSTVKLADVVPADSMGRIHRLIEELGGKLCRCIKKVMAGTPPVPESSAIPICINSIFVRRGLKISAFQCKDGALLLPAAGKTVVLDRQPRLKTILK